jgi:DNA-binding MarR family transcriptional regulator
MHYLDISPRKTVSRIELAEYIGLSASGITRLIAPMKKNGILDKEVNPRDARLSQVKLTKTGQKLYTEAKTSFDLISNELLNSLTPGQQEKIVEQYSRLI